MNISNFFLLDTVKLLFFIILCFKAWSVVVDELSFHSRKNHGNAEWSEIHGMDQNMEKTILNVISTYQLSHHTYFKGCSPINN